MIKIITQPDIYLTENELHTYRQEYHNFCRYHVSPPTFEEYVRARKEQDEKASN